KNPNLNFVGPLPGWMGSPDFKKRRVFAREPNYPKKVNQVTSQDEEEWFHKWAEVFVVNQNRCVINL
ncbi:MAG: hypothetical protein JWM04_1557, partial [Verrucomicrobiales bacterium]|nr:hypothetical protein [Verrucomicrobiales bacterium]